jgi:hypothetical protein
MVMTLNQIAAGSFFIRKQKGRHLAAPPGNEIRQPRRDRLAAAAQGAQAKQSGAEEGYGCGLRHITECGPVPMDDPRWRADRACGRDHDRRDAAGNVCSSDARG